jgi:hypothetical protein
MLMIRSRDNLADEDDIRRRAHHPARRAKIALGVEAHFALVDDRALVGVQELDRVLDGDDVVGAVVVAVIDHAGERSRLAGAGRARHQHQPAWQHAQVAEDLRRVQVIQREDGGGDVAEHRPRAAVLVEGIDTKARQLRNLEGEVGLEEFLVGLALLVVHDVVHHGVHFLVQQRRHIDAR